MSDGLPLPPIPRDSPTAIPHPRLVQGDANRYGPDAHGGADVACTQPTDMGTAVLVQAKGQAHAQAHRHDEHSWAPMGPQQQLKWPSAHKRGTESPTLGFGGRGKIDTKSNQYGPYARCRLAKTGPLDKGGG